MTTTATTTRGVLLINLGSPDSPSAPDVRRYLDEFLSDPRVIDLPVVAQQALLKGVILPTRPRKVSEAYAKIWTDEGSPLITTTYRQKELLAEHTDLPIEVCMRYGNPSAESAVEALARRGVDEVFLIPLYPHYAMSSYETAVGKVQRAISEIAPHMILRVQPPFYDDEDYLDALSQTIAPYLEGEWDHILFTYHGIPERHILKNDSSGCFCLKLPDCCERPNPAHGMCYRAQCFATSRLVAERLGIPQDKYSNSFQSRLGRTPWLKPYTDHEIERFPSENKKRLLVISPAFVSDCLETIEELGMEGRDSFMKAGGKEYHLIPCLNDHPRFIETLAKFVRNFEAT